MTDLILPAIAFVVVPIFSIVVLRRVPALRTVLVNLFLDFQPINGQGQNIFHHPDGEVDFFVKIRFYLKSRGDMDLLNLDLQYGRRNLPGPWTVWIGDGEISSDSSHRLPEPIPLPQSAAIDVTLSRWFRPSQREWPGDYDFLSLVITVNVRRLPGHLSFLVLPGTTTTTVRAKLEPGGELRLVNRAGAR